MIVRAKLISKREIARDTMEFVFEKPDRFVYRAGQSVDIILIDPTETDDEGKSRSFSPVSAPHENVITIASRMRNSAYKRMLAQLEEGSEVEINGPFGNVVLHEDISRPAVLLTGGIGISHSRSLLSDAKARNLSYQIILFYSNRNAVDAAYLPELEELSEGSKTFTHIPTMTRDDSWEGEKGRIDSAMIDKYIPTDSRPYYYIVGPQGFVLAMRDMLTARGASPNDINIEEFAGY